MEIDLATALERDGFAIVPGVLGAEEVERLRAAVGPLAASVAPGALRRRESHYGARDLLRLVPDMRRLARSPEVRRLVDAVLGPEAFPVRGLLFDKTPEANWSVPWHRDLTIAVRERRDVPGYGPWTVKVGVPHVQPPLEVLRGMLTVRLHLDDCGPEHGPLAVLPGSHATAGQGGEADRRLRLRAPAVTCPVSQGDVLLMRPLILHASGSAAAPSHRRVIHLEFAAGALPGGLEWSEPREIAEDHCQRIEVPGGSGVP